MGSYRAGKVLLILGIGQMIFVASLLLFSSMTTYFGAGDALGVDGNYSTSFSTGNCDQPRYILDSDSHEVEEISVYRKDETECKYTTGNYDEVSCSVIDGCTWINDTSAWWQSNNGIEECDGDVNMTALGLNEQVSFGGALYTQLNNQSICEFFGLTWYSYEIADEELGLNPIGNTNLIWNNIKGLLFFQFDFGFEGEYEYWISLIFWFLNILIILHMVFAFTPTLGE